MPTGIPTVPRKNLFGPMAVRRPGDDSGPVAAMGLAIGEAETAAHGGHFRGEAAVPLANR